MTLRTTKLIASMTFGKTCKLIMGRTAAVQHTGGCGEGCRGAPGEGLQLQSGAANLGKKSWGHPGVREGNSHWGMELQHLGLHSSTEGQSTAPLWAAHEPFSGAGATGAAQHTAGCPPAELLLLWRSSEFALKRYFLV